MKINALKKIGIEYVQILERRYKIEELYRRKYIYIKIEKILKIYTTDWYLLRYMGDLKRKQRHSVLPRYKENSEKWRIFKLTTYIKERRKLHFNNQETQRVFLCIMDVLDQLVLCCEEKKRKKKNLV